MVWGIFAHWSSYVADLRQALRAQPEGMPGQGTARTHLLQSPSALRLVLRLLVGLLELQRLLFDLQAREVCNGEQSMHLGML